MKTQIVIRASEGGQESKLLVDDMKNIYIKAANNQGFTIESIEERDGFASVCL